MLDKKIKRFAINSLMSRNQGFKAKLDGELYGDPVESVGVRGKNCQKFILCLESFVIQSFAPSPNVPQ